jgi:hypothetical protein
MAEPREIANGGAALGSVVKRCLGQHFPPIRQKLPRQLLRCLGRFV